MSERAKNEGVGVLMMVYYALGMHYVHTNLWLGSIEIALAVIGLILTIRCNYSIGRHDGWKEFDEAIFRDLLKKMQQKIDKFPELNDENEQ